MTSSEVTCWSMIQAAALGDRAARDRFARVYLPVVRAYLAARWRIRPREIDDAAQDVFVECFKVNGVIERADPGRSAGFRSFLYGVIQNVARRHEAKRPHNRIADDLPADEVSLSGTFDRAWAQALLREAGRIQSATAITASARRRVELLKLRFTDNLPIRAIAERWGVDAAKVHHEYATARDEFRNALQQVVAFHHPDATPAELDASIAQLLECFQ